MTRNPFGVVDVPDPNDEDVTAFATGVRLTGSADDDNAEVWDGDRTAAATSLEDPAPRLLAVFDRQPVEQIVG